MGGWIFFFFLIKIPPGKGSFDLIFSTPGTTLHSWGVAEGPWPGKEEKRIEAWLCRISVDEVFVTSSRSSFSWKLKVFFFFLPVSTKFKIEHKIKRIYGTHTKHFSRIFSSFSRYVRLTIPPPQIVNAQWQTCSKKQLMVSAIFEMSTEPSGGWAKVLGPGSMSEELPVYNLLRTFPPSPEQLGLCCLWRENRS